ncbi:MAG: hypothetical protein QM658_03340 [Gordonia sp. (in: high G+C Gram-positive bacteria)]
MPKDRIELIVDDVAAMQALSDFHLTDEDKAAIRRVLRGESMVEQERETVLAEIVAARTAPPPVGPPIKDNLLGLTDPAELHVAERRLVSCRLAELQYERRGNPLTWTVPAGELEVGDDVHGLRDGLAYGKVICLVTSHLSEFVEPGHVQIIVNAYAIDDSQLVYVGHESYVLPVEQPVVIARRLE